MAAIVGKAPRRHGQIGRTELSQ